MLDKAIDGTDKLPALMAKFTLATTQKERDALAAEMDRLNAEIDDDIIDSIYGGREA